MATTLIDVETSTDKPLYRTNVKSNVAYSGSIVKMSDVIEPQLFADYVQEKTTEKSEIMFAGVVENNPILDRLVTGGSTLITMPKWEDLTGDSEVMSQRADATLSGISSHSEIATMLIRMKAWGTHDLASALAGDDPMRRIADRVSDWWVRDEKRNIISILNGVFNESTMASERVVNADLLDPSKTMKAISATAVLDAKQLLGDNSDLLTCIYMHSAVFTYLQKQNLINTSAINSAYGVSDSNITIPTYLGYRVICDDSTPVYYKYTYDDGTTETVGLEPTSGKTVKTKVPFAYSTYLLSRGCIQRGMGNPVGFVPVETDRYSLGSRDVLINRQAKVLHPKGMSFTNKSVDDMTPTNAELELGENWTVATSDMKNLGMVKLLCSAPSGTI